MNIKVKCLDDDCWYVWFWPRRGGSNDGGVMISAYGLGDVKLIPHGSTRADDDCIDLAPASEDVLSLVRSFSRTHAVAPLIDACIECWGDDVASQIQGVLS